MTYKPDHCRVVTRQGIVTGMYDKTAEVQILQLGACASCRLSNVCTSSDVRAKTVHATVEGQFRIGETVNLTLEERHGMLAVVLAFVVPLILMVAALFGAGRLGATEEIAALIGLAAPAPYFGVLYLARNYFRNAIQLHATPIVKEGLSCQL